MAGAGEVILKTIGLSKHYGGLHALVDAEFELRNGEHVAIMGDNGAGKSTFVRQITGVEQRTAGTIVFDNKEVHFKGPLDAREAGIETVFQNLALADDLDVPTNLFLGREKVLFNLGPFSILDFRGMRLATEAALKRTAVKIPNLSNTIRNMSGGQRQCVAIARTATFPSKLIIMDEPTAALGVQETAQVENIIRQLKANGEPLIIISHNMRQVFDLADRIVVFRRGRIVANLNKAQTNSDEVVSFITGAKSEAIEAQLAAEPGAAGIACWRYGLDSPRGVQTEAPSAPVRKSKLAVMPPSAMTSAALIAAEPSESRNSADRAMSAGSVILPLGWRAARVATNFSGSLADFMCRSNKPAIIGPGLNRLILMPCRAWSNATVRASCLTAPFDAA